MDLRNCLPRPNYLLKWMPEYISWCCCWFFLKNQNPASHYQMSHLVNVTMLSTFVSFFKLFNCWRIETILSSFRSVSKSLATLANPFAVRPSEFSDSLSFQSLVPDINTSTSLLAETNVTIMALIYYLILLLVFVVFVKSLKKE